MKNSFRSLAILFIMIIVNTMPIYAANLQLTGSPTIVSKILPNQGDIYYGFGTLGHYIGRKYSADIQETEVNRTLFSFNIAGIPTNATINSVSVNIYFTDYPSSYKAAITYADFQSGPQNQWAEIGSADVLRSDISYSSGSSFSSTALKTDIQSALGSSEYYLGVFSTNGEITGSTYASVSLQLDIDYTVPPSQVDITVQNNFIYGTIKVGVDQSATQGPSPYPIAPTVGNTVNVEAQDQPYGGYDWIWNDTEAPLNKSKWEKIAGGYRTNKGSGISYSFTAAQDDDNSTYEAGLRKECNISFSNQLNGTTEGGKVTVNGVLKDAPTAQFNVVEQNLITASVETHQYFNNINYIFEKWNDNITSKSRTIYPSSHETYTAIYKGYPIFEDPMRGLVISGVREGKTYYIKLDWNEHPNSYVTQYHIYRYTKYGSVTTDPVHVATRSRGTTTFTDYAFTYAPTTGEYQVYYDVKAYFSPDGTTSPDNYEMARGNDNRIEKSGNETGEEIIKEYAINNYPNPFNPTTTIRYQLPKAGHVQIKVYDAIGKEVTTLVNEHLESGRYEAQFGENNLPSGMYIYTIKVNDYYATKKMLLIK